MGSPQGCGRHPKVAATQTWANNFSPTVGLHMETFSMYLEDFSPQIKATAVTLGLASLRNKRVSLLPKLRSLSLSGKQCAVSCWARRDKPV